MNLSVKALLISIGLATFALSMGFIFSAAWPWTFAIIGTALFWLFGRLRGWNWIGSVGLVGFTGSAVFGLWLKLPSGWMLIGIIAALCAWDLQHFTQRLQDVTVPKSLEIRHLQRLLIVGSLGLLLASIALLIQVEFKFGDALILVLLAILGLSQAIGFLRRESA